MSLQLVPDHDESRWLLKALRETAHEFESQLWGLDETDLRWRLSDDADDADDADGGWCLKEIAAHLGDCEEHLLHSLELIVHQETPRIPALDADALVLEHDYRQLDLYEQLERFEYLRQRTVNLLWSLMPEEWERTGLHPYQGPMSVLRLVHEQNEHDLEHLWQARRLRQALAERAPSTL